MPLVVFHPAGSGHDRTAPPNIFEGLLPARGDPGEAARNAVMRRGAGQSRPEALWTVWTITDFSVFFSTGASHTAEAPEALLGLIR